MLLIEVAFTLENICTLFTNSFGFFLGKKGNISEERTDDALYYINKLKGGGCRCFLLLLLVFIVTDCVFNLYL